MQRAIRDYAKNDLSLSMQNASNQTNFLKLPVHTQSLRSEISPSIEERLRELRRRFSSRTEEIRKKSLVKIEADEEAEEDENEETEEDQQEKDKSTTTQTLTVNIDLQLDDPGEGRNRKKIDLWHPPPRSLHVRRPDCLIPIDREKVPFVKRRDQRLVFIHLDDGGDCGDAFPETDTIETVEIIGQEKNIPTTWAFKLPRWLPTPVEVLSATIAPGGVTNMVWMFLVLLAFVYNIVTIPLREAFDIFDKGDHMHFWLMCDAVADAIYLLDLLLFKPRIQCIQGGIVVTNWKSCARNYTEQFAFKLDVVAVLPLDLLSLIYFRPKARFRVLRFVKFQILIEFFDRTDQRVSAGFAVRLTKTLIYMLYIIHLECCGLYAFNRIQGLNATSWSIGNRKNNPYVYSFYVATKMATSIGNLPHATNPPEFIFMTVYWLTGVYVSAILIGQVIDILDNQRSESEAYKKRMNATLTFMQQLRAPQADIEKVRTWFLHNWQQQKTLDENLLIETLPLKLKTDLLINVHYKTLSKVSLFQNCERTMIFDLIGKLKPVLFLPGAPICEKGEVGLEMYIVQNGFVEVVGGPDNSIVFVTLKEGSVFGEISLLAIAGKNRRTANVRSKGYSTLFRLTKKDFEEAMKNHPDAYKRLIKKATKMLHRDKLKAEEAAKQKAEPENMKRRKSVFDTSRALSSKEASDEEGSVIEVIRDRKTAPRISIIVDQVIHRRSLDPNFLKWQIEPLAKSEEPSIPSYKYLNSQSLRELGSDDRNQSTFNEDLSSLPDESLVEFIEDDDDKLVHAVTPIGMERPDGFTEKLEDECEKLTIPPITSLKAPSRTFGRFIKRLHK